MSAPRSRRLLLALVALQALVLLVLPLLEGPRIASGTEVQLVATGDQRQLAPPEKPGTEIWLDYGLDELDPPAGLGPGDTAYIELEGEAPSRFGAIAEREGDLPEDATWIKLPVFGGARGEIGAGPIEVWWDEDPDQLERIARHLEDEDAEVLVTVRLDNDGDPQILDVELRDG